MKKVFYRISETSTKAIWYNLCYESVGILISLVLIAKLLSIGLYNRPINIFAMSTMALFNLYFAYLIFLTVKRRVFIYELSCDLLILKLFYAKEVARYTAEAVDGLSFEKKGRLAQWPNLILKLKDGRTIKFVHQMEKYSDLADEVERWSGVTLPNKVELLKGRGNECLVTTKL
jgi:hypothetical protein